MNKHVGDVFELDQAEIESLIARATPAPSGTHIGVYVMGATREELERGREAAEAFFASHNCTAMQAAEVSFMLEGALEFGESYDLTPEQENLIGLWEDVQGVVAAAVCKGWEKPFKSADLGLGYTHDQLAAMYEADPRFLKRKRLQQQFDNEDECAISSPSERRRRRSAFSAT